jgi:glycosyltransferase involved in cell wall biosynthesis
LGKGISTVTDYSIIVPAYNEENFLGATLASLGRAMQGCPGRGEMIVVDNASTDATRAIALQMGARVIHEPHRQIARARNAGAAAARGHWLVFVDADTTVPPRTLRSALEMLESGRFVAGGARVQFDRRCALDVRLSLCGWMVLSRFFRWAAGAFVFTRRDAFEAVGGFDQRYYAGEEIHLSRALRLWGSPRGLRFGILGEPVYTSYRKMDWFSRGQMGGMALRLLLDMQPRRVPHVVRPPGTVARAVGDLPPGGHCIIVVCAQGERRASPP